jgi:type IV pilus assembly protein PilN
MIKINLLSGDKPRAARKTRLPQFSLKGQQLTVGCALILVASGGFISWRYYTLNRDSAALDVAISQGQQETVRLHSLIAEVQQFEQRRTQLQQRVGLIEQLRRDQTGPVHMLDQISLALPTMMWLTDLKQTPGQSEVLIEGRCTGLTGLSDFVSNLEASGYFKKSVEIVSTQVEGQGGGDLIKFAVKAQFERPAAVTVAAGAALAAPAPAAKPAT